MTPWTERVIALAAIAQSIALVKQIARDGVFQRASSAEALYEGVLNQTPGSVHELYPDKSQLELGLSYLLQQIGPSQNKDVEITRYMIGILALERKLNRSPKSLDELGKRLQQIHRQKHDFLFEPETVVASMAGTYSDFISPLGPPLKISGKQDHLQQTKVQNHIRALLLAGIRNAVLWRQLGGKRRQFIFSRQRMVSAARQLLSDIHEHPEPQS